MYDIPINGVIPVRPVKYHTEPRTVQKGLDESYMSGAPSQAGVTLDFGVFCDCSPGWGGKGGSRTKGVRFSSEIRGVLV